jgi:predicted dehydrogenase
MSETPEGASSMQLKTAVVGAGVVSDIHMSALEQCPHTDLVAVCDVDEERAIQAANRYDIQAVYSIDRLLEEVDLDWMHICTPVKTHLDIARQAITAGIPVNIEKPLTETVAEADDLIQLSRDHGVPVSVTHQHRFDPALREAQTRIDAGELGELRSVDLLYMGETPPDQANRGDWAFDLVGGEFEEGLPHPLYIVLGTGGYPEHRDDVHVITDLHSEYDRPFAYDGVGVSYRTESGTLCSMKCIAAPTPQKMLAIHGEKKTLNVDFVSQTVVEITDGFNGSPTAKVRNNVSRAKDRLAGTVKNVYRVAREQFSDEWEDHISINAHAYQIDAEARALLANESLPVPLEEGRWTVELMERIREEAISHSQSVVDEPPVTSE